MSPPVGWAGADPVEDADTADYELGVEMVANVDITITHVRVFGTANAEDQPSRQGKIWDTTTGTVLATATMPTTLTPGWNSYALGTPLERTAGQRWLTSFASGGRYGFIGSALGSDVVSGDGAVTFLSHANSTAGNGRINNTPGSYPTTATAGTFWGTDVEYLIGVGNTAPEITALALSADGLTVTAAITATDLEGLVGAAYLIDWQDGSTTAAASGSHTYASAGLKAILASVTDSGGLADYRAGAILLVDPDESGFTARREAIAAALTGALSGVPVTVYPKLPTPLRVGSGWLVFKIADTQDIAFGETARWTLDVVVALGVDSNYAEDQLDAIAAPMIAACSLLGRGVTVAPITLNVDGTDFYCAVATLITEVE